MLQQQRNGGGAGGHMSALYESDEEETFLQTERPPQSPGQEFKSGRRTSRVDTARLAAMTINDDDDDEQADGAAGVGGSHAQYYAGGGGDGGGGGGDESYETGFDTHRDAYRDACTTPTSSVERAACCTAPLNTSQRTLKHTIKNMCCLISS